MAFFDSIDCSLLLLWMSPSSLSLYMCPSVDSFIWVSFRIVSIYFVYYGCRNLSLQKVREERVGECMQRKTTLRHDSVLQDINAVPWCQHAFYTGGKCFMGPIRLSQFRHNRAPRRGRTQGEG